MASNTSNVRAEDPTMDFRYVNVPTNARSGWLQAGHKLSVSLGHRLFNDSLQRDAAGNLLPCWDGFSMNPAPSVGSFGRFQLKRIAEWVTRHDLDGVFLDFYGDTTMVDESRTRGQFPFYAMQDAEVEFAKAIADWAHARQKYLIINCPQASMAVQHIADLVTVRRLPMPALSERFVVSLADGRCTGRSATRRASTTTGRWAIG